MVFTYNKNNKNHCLLLCPSRCNAFATSSKPNGPDKGGCIEGQRRGGVCNQLGLTILKVLILTCTLGLSCAVIVIYVNAKVNMISWRNEWTSWLWRSNLSLKWFFDLTGFLQWSMRCWWVHRRKEGWDQKERWKKGRLLTWSHSQSIHEPWFVVSLNLLLHSVLIFEIFLYVISPHGPWKVFSFVDLVGADSVGESEARSSGLHHGSNSVYSM